MPCTCRTPPRQSSVASPRDEGWFCSQVRNTLVGVGFNCCFRSTGHLSSADGATKIFMASMGRFRQADVNAVGERAGTMGGVSKQWRRVYRRPTYSGLLHCWACLDAPARVIRDGSQATQDTIVLSSTFPVRWLPLL